MAVEPDSIQVVSKRADLADRCFIIRINDSFKKRQGFIELIRSCGSGHTMAAYTKRRFQGTVAKLAMRQPFVLFKGLTFQKLCLPGAFRPGDHHNKML
ncbi:hypothetical protein ACJ8HG_25845, partial [Serratia sp. CY27690]